MKQARQVLLLVPDEYTSDIPLPVAVLTLYRITLAVARPLLDCIPLPHKISQRSVQVKVLQTEKRWLPGHVVLEIPSNSNSHP